MLFAVNLKTTYPVLSLKKIFISKQLCFTQKFIKCPKDKSKGLSAYTLPSAGSSFHTEGAQ